MKHSRRRHPIILGVICAFLIISSLACAPANNTPHKNDKENSKKKTLVLATTTSTQDSGLLDYILPIFEKKYNTSVKVVAVGSGQALTMGKMGDADVLLVHSPADEEKFMKDGYGVLRKPVMHNLFLLVGPPEDPAQVKSAPNIEEAMKRIAASQSTFISRGDDSGTHKKELSLWKAAGISPKGAWYVEAGQGMGDTLMMAGEKKAYTISDEATFLTFKAQLPLTVLRQGDKELYNMYHVIVVNPDKHSGLNYTGAKDFVSFITSEEGQKLIAGFGRDRFGKSLFIPDAASH